MKGCTCIIMPLSLYYLKMVSKRQYYRLLQPFLGQFIDHQNLLCDKPTYLSQSRINFIPGSLKNMYLKEHHQLHKITLNTTAQMTTQLRDIDSNYIASEWRFQ